MGSGALVGKRTTPLPLPTHARKQMQRKYYTMRWKSFQGIVYTKMEGRMIVMRSILEEFAYGNISAEAHFYNPNSRYGQAMGALSKNEEKLLESMNESEKEVFQKYIDDQGEVNELMAVRNMVYGYKRGLIMTAEAFLTNDNLITGEED